jgi:hypothetical protein
MASISRSKLWTLRFAGSSLYILKSLDAESNMFFPLFTDFITYWIFLALSQILKQSFCFPSGNPAEQKEKRKEQKNENCKVKMY